MFTAFAKCNRFCLELWSSASRVHATMKSYLTLPKHFENGLQSTRLDVWHISEHNSTAHYLKRMDMPTIYVCSYYAACKINFSRVFRRLVHSLTHHMLQLLARLA